MEVRQRGSIQHRPPGMFQPAFQNVRLRVHAGSMGDRAIRRIGWRPQACGNLKLSDLIGSPETTFESIQMITAIKSLENAGVFAPFSTSAQSLPFRRYNLIYGFNGAGKSTFTRLFASLQFGKMQSKLPESCKFSMVFADGTKLQCPDELETANSGILVFNSDYIERNFHWGEGKAEPVFYIGETQAEAAKKLEKIQDRLPSLQERKTTAEQQLKNAKKELVDFKRETAKSVAQRLHRENRKYEAPQLTKDFEDWTTSDLVELSKDELETAEKLRISESPPPKLTWTELQIPQFSKMLESITELCQKNIGDIVVEELKTHPSMLLWARDGLAYHEEHSLSKCLFCGEGLSEARKSLLRTALNESVKDVLQQIDKYADRLTSLRETFSNVQYSFPLDEQLSSNVRSKYAAARLQLISDIQWGDEIIRKLADYLAKKKVRLSEALELEGLPSPTEAIERTQTIRDRLEDLHAILRAHNSAIDQHADLREQAEISIRKHFVLENEKKFSKLVANNDEAQSRLTNSNGELQTARTEADQLRQQIRTHGPAAQVINKLISNYLGHNEIEVSALEEGYELKRHGKAIVGTPSEGEKTAISISYFLSSVESDGRKLKDSIIIVDDPVSSLDSRALNFACSLLKSRLSQAKQLFILTHNQQCLNEFRKFWKSKFRPISDGEPSASFFFLDVRQPASSDKRQTTLIELPKLLREYDSEYHFLFSQILKFKDSGETYSEYGYMMPNVLRRTLDVFLAFRCPGNTGLIGKFEQLVGQYPSLQRDKLNALERLTQVESHSDNLDDLISFSSMTIEECRNATEALLYMMEEVDPNHSKLLTRLCSK
ncbi:MAG: metallophosphoesterase [Hyphomonadaceae bacterium]|nr:metallophosphoesterase [Hyphomonadaceae bacterium]